MCIRDRVESAGIRDILSKSLGSRNPHNAVKATIAALKQLRDISATAARRGKTVEDISEKTA